MNTVCLTTYVACALTIASGKAALPAWATDRIFISPVGSDATAGTTQSPVATLQQAQRLARHALAQGHGEPAAQSLPAESHEPNVMSWLGAEVKSVTTSGKFSATDLGRAEGVLILRVSLDSAAACVGLRNNDAILKLNARAVRDGEGFIAAWQALTDATLVQLSVWREQKQIEIEMRSSK